MPISVTCSCGRQLLAKDEFAGRHTQCPGCGADLAIPGPPVDEWEQPKPAWKGNVADASVSGLAIASFVLGILSFCGNFFTGIPALILGILGLNAINGSQGRLKGQGLAIAGLVTASVGMLMSLCILPALLLPAVQSAREAARRAQCVNNLKQVALAMHNFESANGRLPPAAIRGNDGTPLLSWRVAILPWIGEDALHKQFKLDEPWDSPHNRGLLARIPRTYQCPSRSAAPNDYTTAYQVFVGPGTLFEEGARVSLAAVTDGPANTLLVAESSNPVPWTKPEELTYVPNGTLPALGSNHPGGYNVVFADGSVRFVKLTEPRQDLESMIVRNDGRAITTMPR